MFALLPFLYPSIGVELMDESLSFPAAKFLQRNAFLYQRRVHATYHEVPDLIFSWSDAGRTRGSRRGLILSEFELQANQHLSLNAFQFADVQTSRGLAPARMTDHLSPVLDLSLNDESSNLAYYYGQNAQDIGLDSSFFVYRTATSSCSPVNRRHWHVRETGRSISKSNWDIRACQSRGVQEKIMCQLSHRHNLPVAGFTTVYMVSSRHSGGLLNAVLCRGTCTMG